MDLDRRIAAIAACQRGVFTRAQAVAAGATTAMVQRRVATGLWIRMHQGVFRVAGAPPSWEQSVMAAWLAAGEGAAVSHASAAGHWGLPGIGQRLEVTVSAGRRPTPAGVTVHRTKRLDRIDVARENGLRVTTPTRTLIDLSSRLDDETAGRVLDHCLSRRLTTLDFLARRLNAIGGQGRSGAQTLRRLLHARPSQWRAPESEFEQALLRLLETLPGPRPVPQYQVRLPNGRVLRLDVAYPDHKLDIEANSYTHHSSLGDWSSDNSRNSALVALGWRVLPVTWTQVTCAPDAVLDLVLGR